MGTAQHFVFILVEDHTHIALACAVEPLRIANLVSGEDLYSWSFASENGESAKASNGIVSLVDTDFAQLPKCDRLFVLTGINMQDHVSRPLLAALRRERARGISIGALCSGAWVLAEAGFLDGMEAAIHWEYHDGFAERFPDVSLVRKVFVADSPHVTASGGTATADLMLHLIGDEHGSDLALAVADQLVYNAVRDATGEQKVSLQSRNGMRNPHLVKAIRIMQSSIEEPISPKLIAQEIGISGRQLERLFGKYLNTSPKRYFMEMRLERARNLLVQTESSIIDVALACGFENAGHFSRVYRSMFGVGPSSQRERLN